MHVWLPALHATGNPKPAERVMAAMIVQTISDQEHRQTEGHVGAK